MNRPHSLLRPQIRIPFVCMMLALFSMAQASTQEEPVVLRAVGGIVSEGKKPVKDATVSLSRSLTGTPVLATVKTDKQGRYRFTGLTASSYVVSASAKGLATSAFMPVIATAYVQGGPIVAEGTDIVLRKEPPKKPKTDALGKTGLGGTDLAHAEIVSIEGRHVLTVDAVDHARVFELVDARGAVRERVTVPAGASRVQLPASLQAAVAAVMRQAR
jgi:hypothetical protein